MKKTGILLFLLFCLTGFSQQAVTGPASENSPGKEKMEQLNKRIAEDTSGNYHEYYRQAVSFARANHNRSWEIEADWAMGEQFSNQPQPDSAIRYLTAALQLSRENKLVRDEVVSQQKLGNALKDAGDKEGALKNLQEALVLGKKNDLNREVSRVLEDIGLFYYDERDYKKSLEYFNIQLGLVQALQDSSSIAACENNVGLAYYSLGNYLASISHYTNAMEIKKALHEDEEVAKAHLNIGITYKEEGNYDQALEHLLAAIAYFEKQPPSRNLASCYNTIGNIKLYLGKYDEALKFHERSLEVREKINFESGIAKSLTNIADVYRAQGKYDLALDYVNRSLVIKRKLNDKVMIATSLDLAGQIYFLRNDFARAERYYLESLSTIKEIEDPKDKATTLNHLGELYFAWNKPAQALASLGEGRAIAQQIGAKTVLLKNYEITIAILRKTGKPEEALAFFDLYTKLKAEMLNEQKNKKIAELEVKYETEQKAHDLELTKARSRAQDLLLSRQHTLIFSLGIGAVLLAVIILLLSYSYRAKRKDLHQSKIIIGQKQQIIEQKQTMMRELHHRIKNNLQVLSSIIELQQHRAAGETDRQMLQTIEHRLNAMLLIHKDLYGEKIDAQVNMKQYLSALTENLTSSFDSPQQQVRTSLEAEPVFLDADRALCLGFITNEIISNAFKHAFHGVQNPELNISFRRNGTQLRLLISDNGTGLPGEMNIQQSSSFGIRLIHLLGKDLKAETKFSSGPAGTTVQLDLPIESQP